MHELSIAQSICNQVLASCKNRKVKVVEKVHVSIGAMSGVSVQALQFCWGEVAQESRLKNSKLVITHVPLKLKCLVCKKEHEINDTIVLQCPECHSRHIKIVAGQELSIDSISVSYEN